MPHLVPIAVDNPPVNAMSPGVPEGMTATEYLRQRAEARRRAMEATADYQTRQRDTLAESAAALLRSEESSRLQGVQQMDQLFGNALAGSEAT